MRSVGRWLVPFSLAIAVAVAGCSDLPWLPTSSPLPETLGVKVVTPPELMRLEVSNGTTIPVMLTVNGAPGRPITAGQGSDLGLADLGPLPWVAQVRTATGRARVETIVRAGDVWSQQNADGSGETKGHGARVDLSCGRIDLWSGVPMHGPAPGSGVPGDCDP